MARIIQSRIFRCIICVFLIGCLLFNLSPIRAEAAGATATAVVGGVAIGLAVAAGMQALGVRAGTDASTFTSLVNSCADALSPTWAVDGLVTMLSVASGSVTRTYASENFLQAILDWLFASDIVSIVDSSDLNDDWTSSCSSHSSTYSYVCLVSSVNMSSVPYFYLCYNNDSPFIFSLSSSGNYVLSTLDGSGFSYLSGPVSGSPVGRYGPFASVTFSSSDFSFRQVSSDSLFDFTFNTDLTLESVGQEIDTDYQTYVDTGIVSVDFGIQFEDNPNTDRDESDDNNAWFLCVRLLEMLDGYYANQTQAEAQTGESQVELDYGDSSGGGSDSGTDSGGSSSGSSGSWVPPSDYNTFALGDLSKFFPFCIPFDLFDFFSLLSADPVAPVLSWEIRDLAGNTYPIEIDLSEWDSLALLFRRLQLLLFITGLAAASRKFIKW